MNAWIFTAALMALLTALVHSIAGGKEIVRPLIAAPIDVTVKKTLHAVWHLVTVFLFLSALALWWAAWQPLNELVIFIAANYLLFGCVFLGISLSTQWHNRLFRLPQWTLLLGIGLLCLLGIR